MEDPNIQFVGSPCGQHGPYTFYKAFEYSYKGTSRILSLGEFFFVKIAADSGVSVCELQLLWEDKNNDNQYLASLTIYFIPENTQESRQGYHGEDELIRENDKIVMKVSDLLTWVTECDDWHYGTLLPRLKDDKGLPTDQQSLAKLFADNNCGLQLLDVNKENRINEAEESLQCTGPQVLVLSYPQYCRFMAIKKRLDRVEDTWLKSALVCALGGIAVSGSRQIYVTFCRDTICHQDLAEHDFRQDHLAPNLKGRPRKKKLKSRSGNGDSDSNESDVSFEIKGRVSREASGRRSFRQLSQDQDTKEEARFLENLYSFMRKHNTPIDRVPSLGFKQLDLFAFYNCAKKYGGYEAVTQKRLWKVIYDRLGGNPGSTSAATCTRRHYERLLLPYERHLRELSKLHHKPKPKDKKVHNGQLRKPQLVNTDAKLEHNHHKNNHHLIVSHDKIKKEEEKWERVRKNSLMEEKPKFGLSLGVRRTVRKELELRQKVKEEDGKVVENMKTEEKPQATASSSYVNGTHVNNSNAENKIQRLAVNTALPSNLSGGVFPKPLTNVPHKQDLNGRPSVIQRVGHTNGLPPFPPNEAHSSHSRRTSFGTGVIGMPPAAHSGKSYTLPPDTYPGSVKRPRLDSNVPKLPCNPFPPTKPQLADADQPMDFSVRRKIEPKETQEGEAPLNLVIHKRTDEEQCSPASKEISHRPHLNLSPGLRLNVSAPHISPNLHRNVARAPIFHPPNDGKSPKPVLSSPSLGRMNTTSVLNTPPRSAHMPITPSRSHSYSQHATPMRTSPMSTVPIRTSTVSLGSMRTPLMSTGPMRTPPLSTGPMRTPPISTGPMRTPPISTGPMRTPPMPTGPMRTPPVSVGLSRTTPVSSAPMRPTVPSFHSPLTHSTQRPMLSPSQDAKIMIPQPQYVQLLHPAFPQLMLTGGTSPQLMVPTTQGLVYEARLQTTKLESSTLRPNSQVAYAPQLFMPTQKPHS